MNHLQRPSIGRNGVFDTIRIGLSFVVILFALVLSGHFVDQAGAQEPAKAPKKAAENINQKPVEDAQPAIAFAARVVGDENRARLIVDFDKKIKFDAYLLDRPKRIIIDLPETLFSLDGEEKRLPATLVSDFRFGSYALGKSRIVLQLQKAVLLDNKELKPVAGGNRHRLLLDLVKTTEAKFSAEVRPPPKPKVNATNAGADKNKVDKPFIIVIDPGHGGVDGGASGQGKVVEKHVTLGFAKRLQEQLAGDKRFRVLLTRDNDIFMGLQDRVKFARKNNADLMISIHADSLKQQNIRGATVYTLSREGSDALSEALADEQNKADLVAGLALPKEDNDVADILIDLTRRETKAFSVRFARLMVKRMRDEIRLIRNPHRSADFFVLKAPEIPSVLLELGYLSNKEDEGLMQSDEWQNKATTKLRDAIVAFFEPRFNSKLETGGTKQ